jgi:YHS domain-containing protein
MHRVLFIIFIFVLGFALVMCTGEKKEEAEVEESAETQEAVVADTAMAVCPGCGMEMQKSDMVAHETDGETEYFCSQECMENYLATSEAEEGEETPPPPPAEE